MARSTGEVTPPSDRAEGPDVPPDSPSTNREALRILMARRLPTRNWLTSRAVSVPGRAEQAQYRMASDPCSSSISTGVTTLPLDLDIFLRSGSRIHPLMLAWAHGR